MKVNNKILSIPPYISTSWKNVISLHIENRSESRILVIGLVNGSTIEIPNLDPATLQVVFAEHEKHLEQDLSSKPSETSAILPEGFPGGGSAILSLPLNLGMDANMGNLLQHDGAAADSPDLPVEMIEQIAQLSKAIGLDNLENFPKPEPHCNCMHCQIMRVVRSEDQEEHLEAEGEEEITDADLRFREWDIEQKDVNLYVVANPFNKDEKFNVFLGNPVGCTCGEENCEHIRAVLNS